MKLDLFIILLLTCFFVGCSNNNATSENRTDSREPISALEEQGITGFYKITDDEMTIIEETLTVSKRTLEDEIQLAFNTANIKEEPLDVIYMIYNGDNPITREREDGEVEAINMYVFFNMPSNLKDLIAKVSYTEWEQDGSIVGEWWLEHLYDASAGNSIEGTLYFTKAIWDTYDYYTGELNNNQSEKTYLEPEKAKDYIEGLLPGIIDGFWSNRSTRFNYGGLNSTSYEEIEVDDKILLNVTVNLYVSEDTDDNTAREFAKSVENHLPGSIEINEIKVFVDKN